MALEQGERKSRRGFGQRPASRLLARLAAVLLAVPALLSTHDTRAAPADDVRQLLARGEHEAALQRARAAAQVDPRDAQARFLEGVVLIDMRRDDEALALFTTMSQRYPELPDPLNNIALLHARAGRLDEALAALQAALRNDPGHRSARINLGQVHLMLALQAWEQVAAAAPPGPGLQRKLEAARALSAMPLETAGAAPGR